MRDLRPDLVLAHGGDAFKYVALDDPFPHRLLRDRHMAGRRPPESPELVVAGPDPQSLGLRRRLRRRRDDLHDVLAVAHERIVVIPNGRDAERFRPPAERREGDEVSLLFVGAFTEGKRPDRFVELVRRLRERDCQSAPPWWAMDHGGHRLEPDAKSAGIELTGFRDDVLTFLQNADVFVFPSAPDGEGMPGVLIEAGLCGLPVVATRVAGASTVLDNGGTGLLVDIDDADALAEAVAALVRDPARRHAMGQAARARCTSRFALPSWPTAGTRS